MDSQASPVVVARIIKPHGIRGEVVLESFSDVEGRFEDTNSFLLMNQGVPLRKVEVESWRYFNGRYVLRFQGVVDRNEAEKLRGMDLAVPENEKGDLPEDHYFIHDLVGMMVRLVDGREVGRVKSVVATAGGDLLEVGESGKTLIPFVDAICLEVNQEKREITVDPPEGLLTLNEN